MLRKLQPAVEFIVKRYSNVSSVALTYLKIASRILSVCYIPDMSTVHASGRAYTYSAGYRVYIEHLLP